MAQDNSRPDVAVFIDFENVYVSVRDKLDANPNFEAIMDRCSELGRVVISRAYADWYRYPRVTSALYANGVEPMYVPTYYYDKEMGRTGRAIKNSADMNMCIDAMKTLFTNTNIAKFVLCTGDRDFIPLVNMIRQQGKDVIVIGIGGAASAHLAQSADEFIFYEQLIGKPTAPQTREPSRERDRPRSPERSKPFEAEPEVEPIVVAPVSPPLPPIASEPTTEADPFDILVDAVHLARKRGYVCTLGSLKLVMKELMGGDFKESRYKDVSGRPFAKFKDFVLDAERRGKVLIFTNGTVNEVFLPGEDPYKLSQFAGDLKEEPVEIKVDPVPSSNGRQPPRAAKADTLAEPQAGAPAGRSRRRRRSRGGKQAGQSAMGETPMLDDELLEADELLESEELPELAPEDLQALPTDELPDEFFSFEAGDEGSDLAETDLVEALLVPDDVVELPGMDIFPPDMADELIDALDLQAEPGPQEPQADEVELLAQSEVVEETAAALVAEMAIEEDLWSPIQPSVPSDHDDVAQVELHTDAPAAESVAQQEAPPAEESELTEAAAEAVEVVDFTPEEWQIFRQVMGTFSKPVAFAQIFDSLRVLRQQQQLARTNEQLRTLVKQAINTGMLERSGRGTRVYYRLAEEA